MVIDTIIESCTKSGIEDYSKTKHGGIFVFEINSKPYFLKTGFELNKRIIYHTPEEAQLYLEICNVAKEKNIFHPDSIYELDSRGKFYSVKALIPLLNVGRWSPVLFEDEKTRQLNNLIRSYSKFPSRDIFFPFNWGLDDGESYYFDLHITDEFEF
ncbi:hypothetical protein JXM83_01910 [Candidatus Woesearchaeota archaeon]|nr:hypothetical protein [Candidatus Woesearchaeota archaeon]